MFKADSASIAQNYTIPEWFKDAKFGIFIHWGVYSVPAYGSEWYSRWMYKEGHPINKYHVQTYGPLTKFGYKDFIPMFKAEISMPTSGWQCKIIWSTIHCSGGRASRRICHVQQYFQ